MRKPISESLSAILAFIEEHPDWVMEGCYADLLEAVLPHATEVRFLNPGIEVCLANCRSRPWEPEKYPSPEEQDAPLELVSRVRHDECGGRVGPEPHFSREARMGRCEVCGNEYHLSFEVVAAGNRHVFDSFECAIHKMAPICGTCGVKVVGHGIEANDTFYCCAHCARKAGVEEAVDHV